MPAPQEGNRSTSTRVPASWAHYPQLSEPVEGGGHTAPPDRGLGGPETAGRRNRKADPGSCGAVCGVARRQMPPARDAPGKGRVRLWETAMNVRWDAGGDCRGDVHRPGTCVPTAIEIEGVGRPGRASDAACPSRQGLCLVVGSPYRQAPEPSLVRSCPLVPRSGLRFCNDRHPARADANCAFCRHRSPRRRRFVGVVWKNPWCHLEACAGRLPDGRPPGLGPMPCTSPRSRVETVSGRTPASAAWRRCESSSCRVGSPRAPAGPPLAARFPPDVAEGPFDAGARPAAGAGGPVAGPGPVTCAARASTPDGGPAGWTSSRPRPRGGPAAGCRGCRRTARGAPSAGCPVRWAPGRRWGGCGRR